MELPATTPDPGRPLPDHSTNGAGARTHAPETLRRPAWHPRDPRDPSTTRSKLADVAGGALRGVLGAMAMSGARVVTQGFGELTQTPPKAILGHNAIPVPGSRRHRPAVTELAHWTYGGVAGAAYGAAPASWRRSHLAAPAFGLLIWVGFEAVIAPVLGIKHPHRARPRNRAMLALDHVLYGVVLGSRLLPPDRLGHRIRQEGDCSSPP